MCLCLQFEESHYTLLAEIADKRHDTQRKRFLFETPLTIVLAFEPSIVTGIKKSGSCRKVPDFEGFQGVFTKMCLYYFTS